MVFVQLEKALLSRNYVRLGLAHTEVGNRTEKNSVQKWFFWKPSMCFSLSWNSSEWVSKGFFFRLTVQNKTSSIFIFCEMVWKRIVFFSEEWLGTKTTKFWVFFCNKIIWNGILRIIIFCRMVRNEIWAILSSAEWLGTEFRAFPVPQNRRITDRMNQNFCLFDGIIISQKVATLNVTSFYSSCTRQMFCSPLKEHG